MNESNRTCANYTQGNTTKIFDQLSNGLALVDKLGTEMWRLNGLLLLNAILVGVMVVIGAYAPHYRRHPVVGAFFLGATSLFLPIISYVASTVNNSQSLLAVVFQSLGLNGVWCGQSLHLILVLTWTGLVVVIGISASLVVAGDAREGRNIDPPIFLTIKAVWTAYLTFSIIGIGNDLTGTIYIQLFVIMFTKLIFKYYTFYKAQRSFSFGRSPRLIAGYMGKKQVGDEHNVCPPALIVMGEDTVPVEKEPHGYSLKTWTNSRNRLVTLDRVWGLQTLTSTQAKDLCFSFALFKLLRCRFAKYTVVEAGFIKARMFFHDMLLKGADNERIFGVIADELSFIHDYYYSSLPIYYSHHLLPVLSIVISLYSIGYCLFLMYTFRSLLTLRERRPQMYCLVENCQSVHNFLQVGDILFDTVPTFLVIAVLLLAEVRDIVSYICSNWTKVALICHYVNQDAWQQSPAVRKRIDWVLKKCRCKLVNSWDDEMKLCSILLLHPRNTPLHCLRHLLRLRDRKKKVKVQSEVKAAIFQALKREGLTCEQDGAPKHIRLPSPPILGSIGCSNFQIVFDEKWRPTNTILAWHVATSIFEVGHAPPSDPGQEGHKIAATHLSSYCAYLVAYCPELLPDDDEWCKSLYDNAKKDCHRVLFAAPGVGYHRLLELLDAEDNHDVIRNGARLGKQLVDSVTQWEALARFWSEMILYVAPSENLEGHAAAIARGGELITLLWALLEHAGIVGRLDADATATTRDAGGV